MSFIVGLVMGACSGVILMAICTLAGEDDIRNGRK